MKAHIVSCLGLALVLGCTPSAGGTGPEPPAQSAAPSAAGCGASAYRHASPDFCVDLPASAKGKDPTTIADGVTFPGVTLNWVAKTDAAHVAQWKAPAPAPEHHGTFEVLATEALPGGTYYLVHDATQHDRLDIYKVPSVRGVAVIEGGPWVVRCTVTVALERGDDARKVAAAHAADLAACKSLRVPG